MSESEMGNDLRLLGRVIISNERGLGEVLLVSKQ